MEALTVTFSWDTKETTSPIRGFIWRKSGFCAADTEAPDRDLASIVQPEVHRHRAAHHSNAAVATGSDARAIASACEYLRDSKNGCTQLCEIERPVMVESLG